MKTTLFLSGAMFDSRPVNEHLAAAAANGYTGVQIRSTHLTPDTPIQDRELIKARLKELGLKVNLLSCFVGNFALLSESECDAAMTRLLDFARLSVEVGAPMIRVWPGWVESARADADMFDRAVRWLRRSSERSAELGVGLALEMHHGTLLDKAESARRLLDAVNRENVGLIFDPVNLYQTPTAYGTNALQLLAGKIFDVHVKDIIQLADDSTPGCFAYSYYAKHIGRFAKVIPPEIKTERCYSHRRIGQGGVDWFAVLKGLKKIGYNATFTVESVKENNPLLPDGCDLAAACMADWQRLENL